MSSVITESTSHTGALVRLVEERSLRVILIGGTSHMGKSTLAEAWAAQLGWSHRSTDWLARHPGRPWRTPPNPVPEHVATHYQSLSVDELVADVLRHYRDNVWPLIEAIVAFHATEAGRDRLVLEGSALLPELAAHLNFSGVGALWFTSGRELLEQRLHHESGYVSRSPDERRLIDQFRERSWRFNECVANTAADLHLPLIVVEQTHDLSALTELGCGALRRKAWRSDGVASSARRVSRLRDVPYRIETKRLMVRCWEAQDAGALKAAIDGSLVHLQAWAPWARTEPEPLARKRRRIVEWRDRFLRLQCEFAFGIFSHDDGDLLGACAIKFRDEPGIACLGYWIRADQVGRGFVTEAVGALTRVVFDVLHVPTAEIFCDPRNTRSAAVPRRLGFIKLEAEQSRRLASGEDRLSQIWHLRASDVTASSVGARPVVIRNLLGETLWPPPDVSGGAV